MIRLSSVTLGAAVLLSLLIALAGVFSGSARASMDLADLPEVERLH